MDYNIKILHEIAQGDDIFLLEMVSTFIENVTVDIGSIQNLKSTENWLAIAGLSHKLASNFGYLGANSLHTLAGDIEKCVIDDGNLHDISAKVERLCAESLSLIADLKLDFGI